GSTVTGRAVSVIAHGGTVIWALTLGGTATLVGSSGRGFTGAATGAGSRNTVKNTVRARARNKSKVNGQTVTISASDGTADKDTPSIQDVAGGFSLLGGWSENGFNGTVGVSLALNEITNTTEAAVEASQVAAAAGVNVTARSTATIYALTMA